MTILSIDRSTSRGTFAIVRDGAGIVSGEFAESTPRSPEWFPALVAALGRCGLEPSALDAIVVGTGPGSFSGIRAVLAAAQGLALPANVPVWGVLSSAALAAAERRRTGAPRVAVIGDARRGSLWLADDAPDAAPHLVPYPDAPAALAAMSGARIVSPDASRVAAILGRLMPEPPELVEAVPTAGDIAAFFAAHPGAAVRDPVPAYLHPAVEPPRRS